MKKAIFILLTSITVIFRSNCLVAADEEKLTLTVTASSVYLPYYAADKTIDNNPSTYWIGGRNLAPWWIVFDAGNVHSIDKILVMWYSSVSYVPRSYDIQVSDDAVNWINVFTDIQGVAGASGDYRDIKREARYIRLYMNSVPVNFPIIKEFAAYKNTTIPRVMRFKGRLRDGNTELLTGVFKLTFRVYDTETGGLPLWTETHAGLSVEAGVFDVELGSITPLDVTFDRQYWLGVEVESNQEMLPRFRFSSVPYSFKSL